MNVGDVDSSKRAAEKKSRNFFVIGYAFLLAMALFWSVDSSIVYIFFGIGCFFLFLGFFARPVAAEKTYQKSYRPQGHREYQSPAESVEDKIKEIFQRKTTGPRTHVNDPMAKGRKIALAIGASFFVLFMIPFVVAIFGSGSADSMSYYMMGQLHFSEGKYDSASTDYRRALAIDPEYTEAMVGYGEVLVARNELDSAVLMFDRALAIKPDYPEATYKKAAAWYDQRKYNEAIGILTPLFVDNPQYFDAMLLMGDRYYIQNNYVDAISWYENAYQNGGIRSANLLYVMAYIYDTKQDYPRAIELYKETLTYDDTIADIYKRLGELIPGEEGNAYRTKAMELQK